MSTWHVKLLGDIPTKILKFRQADILETMGEPFVGCIVVESDEHDLTEDQFLGKMAVIEVKTSAADRYFNTRVISFSHTQDLAGSTSVYRLGVTSWNQFMERQRDFRIFQDMTIPEIIKDVFGRTGAPGKSFSDKLTASYPRREYVVQYDESDFNFVQRLMQREGIYYYFEHSAGDHKLVMCDSPGVHQPCPGYAEVPYSPAVSAHGMTDKEVISTLGFKAEVRTPKHVSRDYYFKTPPDHLEVMKQSDLKPWNSPFEQFTHAGGYIDAGMGQHYVGVRQTGELTRSKVFEGFTHARGLCTGYKVKAIKHDFGSMSEEMLLIGSQTQIEEPRKEAHAAGVSRFECSFHAIPASRQFRAAHTAIEPKVNGHETAQVVGPPGEEIHTDEFGRIRVRFFWDRHIKKMEEASCWIRVAHPWAGKGWGFITLPRVGQEVVVEFEQGDPDRPLIVGSVYNKDEHVPYPLPAKKNVSGIRSRSTLKGGADNFNEFRFDDTIGEEYVWMQAERDHFHLIKRDQNVEIRRHSHLLVKGNSFEERKGSLNIKLDGDLKHKVKGSWGLECLDDSSVKTAGQLGVKSASDMNLETGAQYSLKAGSSVQVEAGSVINLGAGASITLKAGAGSIVIGPSGVIINGPVVKINSGGGGSGPSPKAPDKPAPPEPLEPLIDPLG